jgi:hypothetical protein
MVREGMAMHRTTWDVEEIADTIVRERSAASGPLVSNATHLWPALPGAGVTPVLYGFLAGVPTQWVRSSRRSQHFTEFFVRTWQAHDDGVASAGDDWRAAERIIVSGSDETVAALVAEFGPRRVTGYGHRLSFAIIDDDDPQRWADDIATDVVMWHQTGCFSCRSLVLVGDEAMAQRFAERLAAAIADAERRLGSQFDEGQLARRMQALGATEFETDVFGARHGWVEIRNSVRDTPTPPHVVSLVVVSDPSEVEDAVQVEPRHIQGIAVGGPRIRRTRLADVAERLGATRCTLPGSLQRPPAAWPHDGAANLTAFTREGHGRVRRTTMWIDASFTAS